MEERDFALLENHMKHTRQEAAQPEETSIAAPRTIVNGAMPNEKPFTPDWIPVRPGAQDHEKIPSLFGSRREWRDGRVEAV